MRAKKLLIAISSIFCTFLLFGQSSFTPGRIVAVQTSGATSKFGSAVTLKEYTTSGTSGVSVSLPTSGANTIQMAATLGGSEGFITQSSDGANLIVGGYATSADYSATDITVSTSSTVPRAIYKIDASGNFSKVYSSTTYYSANDIRGGISDGTNYWTSGASVANADGINYFGPSTAAIIGGGATPIKAYGLRIFNGQMYYSSQKAGPSNTSSHLGIFSVGTALPTSGTPTITQIIDMGATNTPADFSFNSTATVCYVAVNLNTAAGGIQKWTKSGSTWSLQYTLGTGVTNIGAYGLVVDYSGANPVIYATTSESTVGNRIIKITDTGSGATATTLVAASTSTWFHGLDFAPCVAPSISSVTSSPICVGNTLNLNLSTTGTTPLTYAWSGPNSFTSSSQNPTISNATSAATGTYSITVSNGCGSASSSVTGTVNALPTATITPSGATTFCSGSSVILTASAGSSYLWSTGATTQAITVSTSGSYSVAVTNASNCSATSSFTSVTVNPVVVPSVSIVSDLGSSVCPNAAVTFTATPTNGGTASYQWLLNGNNVSTDNAVYSTNSIQNSDVVSCVLTSSDACASPSTATSNSISMVVSLPQQPADFTAKNTFVYKGEMGVAYTVPNVSGVTYNWSYSGTGATINGSGNSVTIDFSSIATSGTLSVTANSSCGASAARTVAINLNSPIAIPQTKLDYSFVTVGCNRVDYTDTSATTGLDVASGKSTANVYQLKRLFTEISHLSPLPKYLFLTGDIVMGYKGVADTAELVKQLTNWKQIYQSHPLSSMGITLIAVPGNHETQVKVSSSVKTSYVEAERIFTRVMAPYINGSNGPGVGGADNLATDQSKLTYSFNYGQDHFIVLNTDPTGQDSKVPFRWVANDVQTARANNARHIFAFGHKPAYSSSMKPGDGLENSGSAAYVAQRDSLWKYLENNNCEAMFAAHEHCWDTIHPHAGKTWQVVAGNGGSRVETLFMGAGKQYLGYTLVNLYTDRKVNVMGLGRDADMGTGVGNLFSKNEDFNPTTVRANFNICLTTKSTNTVTACGDYTWNGTNYTNSGTYTYNTTNAAGCDSIATLVLTIGSTIAQPADFTVKNTFVYKGEMGVAYTVPNVTGVTYNWTYSGTGATINGSGNSVTIDFSSIATSGTLSVTANNVACGSSTARTVLINLNSPIAIPQTNLDYSFVTVGCNRVDYTDTSATTGLDVATGKSTANVYQLKRLFTEISHLSPLPKYLFLTGDIVMGYKGVADTAELVKQLTSWKQIYQAHPLSSMNITLVAVPGNHETQNKAAGKTSYVEAERIYTRVMAPYINGSNGPGVGGADNLATDQSKLTYSFNYGQDHFIILNTDPTGQDSKVPFHWVANDVQTARANNARHIFAFGHKPAYSSSMKSGDGLENSGSAAYVAQRDSLWKYLENNNCEAMFAAHEHCWDTIHPHAGKTWQVVAGNGGSRVETLFLGAGKQYLGYTLVNLYTDRKVNVMGLGRDADMGTGVGNLFSKNEDFNPTTVRANFNICLTTKSTNTVTACGNYTWNGTNYTNSGTYTYNTTNAAGCDSIATLVLTIGTSVAQPADFTAKNTFVYKGEMGVAYSVPNVSDVTYNWTYSGIGATINGSGNSVTIDFSSIATNGTLSVVGSNVACTSLARTLVINLNSPIAIPQTKLDYSFVTVGCNRVDYTDTSATTGLDVSTGKSTANVYQLKRLFTEISHISPLPKYLFLTGDIVMGYKGVADTAELVKQLTSWKQIYQAHPLSSMNITLVAIPGNHETQNKAAGKTSYVEAERIYTRLMAPYINGSNGPGVGGADNLATDQSKLTYSFNYGQDHFIVLNTDPTGQDSKVPFHWVANDVQTARVNNARHIFAFGHKPAYSSSMKPGDGLENSGSAAYVAQRDSLWKYLENNNCEAMFAAHEHCWDTIHPHAGKTWQVVAGNGGSRVETLFMGAGKQYLGYTLVNLYTDRKVNVMGLGRDADMGTGVGNLFSKNEDFNPTTVRANFNICLTTKSTNTATVNESYTWNGTNYTNSGTYTYNTINAAGCDSIATLTLTVTHLPAQPAEFTISSPSVIYGQSGVVYTVPNDPLVTYSWSYSGTGATINGTGNSVTVNFASNATSGILGVTAVNNYGNSIARTINVSLFSTDFTPGRIVVLQTNGIVSKSSNPITLKEYTSTGTPGVTVNLPSTGTTPIQSAGVYGGSEGFLTTSIDGKYLVLVGYGTSTSFADVTATASNTVPRVIGQVTPSGLYQQVYSSSTMFNLNDIRSAVSDGTNYWAGGASTANVDGINYVGPNASTVLGGGAIPSKAYSTRIFNNQIYYSTQKAGPSNSASQLGIFSIGSGLQTSGTASPVQIINTGSIIPEDFSFNSTTDICYIAVNLNTASGGIQKWTKSAGTWTLAYTLGTGASNIGAYGLLVDYSGVNPIIYATTFEATGNRVIKITDTGSSSSATTLVAAVAGVYNKGISFAPISSGIPTVNLSVSSNAGSEAGTTTITVTATSSSTLSSTESVALAVTGTNITVGDYTLSNTSITIPSGTSSGSVTFTVVDDVVSEGSETAILTISNPSQGLLLGSTTIQNIVISDNDNTAPTIAINVASTSNYIDGGVASSPVSPYTISGSKGDVTDPLSTLGIDFIINDAETVASSLIVTVASSNTAVVPNGSLVLSGVSAIRNLKINPSSVGFSTITIQVSDGINNTSYVINYAASDSIPKIVLNNTQWHTGMSDASDAIALDNDYYMTADDEVDLINVFSRHNSGLPVTSFNYSSYLNLPDQAKPEVDAEASAKSYKIPNRYYWLGSMSNGKDPFDNKPNRDRLFATTATGTGAATAISVNGYAAIRSALLTWGDTHGYNFTASAAAGVDSKTVSGFAAEGMVFGPDSTTLWIGLRAPLVPTVNRTKAVIAPILNFESWFNNGSQVGIPTFGTPIELNLGGKGIRDIIRLANGTYIIVAGDAGPNLALSSIYRWTGNSADTPERIITKADGKLNMEGVMEVISNDSLSLTKLQVISDGGSDVIYNDGLEAKDYSNLNLRKFRSDILQSIELCSHYTVYFPSDFDHPNQDKVCPFFPVSITPFTIPLESKYTWSNGATTKINPVPSFGKYTCITTDAYGCKHTTYTKTVSNSLDGDFNSDGINNVNDFLLFIPLFNTTCNGCIQDINKDNIINVNDFLMYGPEFNAACHNF